MVQASGACRGACMHARRGKSVVTCSTTPHSSRSDSRLGSMFTFAALESEYRRAGGMSACSAQLTTSNVRTSAPLLLPLPPPGPLPLTLPPSIPLPAPLAARLPAAPLAPLTLLLSLPPLPPPLLPTLPILTLLPLPPLETRAVTDDGSEGKSRLSTATDDVAAVVEVGSGFGRQMRLRSSMNASNSEMPAASWGSVAHGGWWLGVPWCKVVRGGLGYRGTRWLVVGVPWCKVVRGGLGFRGTRWLVRGLGVP
jgi:hypothetical protein